MTFLVTGAAGFIGSNICKLLLRERNTTVVGIDNYNSYYSPALKKRRIKNLLVDKSFVFIQSSFFHTSTLEAIQNKYKPTILIHTAAKVGVRNGEANPLDYIQTNTLGTATLLETIGKNLRHAVLLSSSSVYGNTKLPFKESSELHPLSVYGLSKTHMEEFANNFYARTEIPITIIRPFSVYGPDGRPDMLPMKLLFASLSGKTFTITGKTIKRDWTYIDDLVSAVATIASKPRRMEIVNIGFGAPLTNTTIVKTVENIVKQFGYHLTYEFAPRNPIEIPTTWADTSVLQKTYNTIMPTSFEVGFHKTAEFFFSHKHLYDHSV